MSRACDAELVPYVIAQLSDVHIGGPHVGSGERFSEAIAEINAMQRQPDLVLLTGDNTRRLIAWAEENRNLFTEDRRPINRHPLFRTHVPHR
jgi:3',5'-cyclic AMP phosphodiesterase CpdA